MNKSCYWDEIWAKTNDDEGFWWWARRETDGVRANKIFAYIKKHSDNLRRLKTIEVGAGSGVYSLNFAKRGAFVTLMDNSESAILLARKYFDSVGLSASFVLMDALNLKPDLLAKFDVAMSFGTVEHYRYPERFLMARAHTDLVKTGGIVIISVPNRLFLPHEILKFYLQRKGKWHLGYEGAFMRHELFRLGNRLGLKNVEVYGSSFISDIFRYFFIIQGTQLFQEIFRFRIKRVTIKDFSTPLDNLLGGDLFLMGQKPEPKQLK